MKKLIILALTAVMMAGCDQQNSDGTYKPTEEQRTYIIDSCEYIGILDWGSANFLTHKGNCRFCAERRKQEIKELIKELK